MAQAAQTAQRVRQSAQPQVKPPLAVVVANADIKADPEQPTTGVARAPILIGLAAAIWFVGAMVLLFASGNPFDDYLLVIVAGFAVMFFGLTLGLARRAAMDKRWGSDSKQSVVEFVEKNVGVATGTIAAREAMVQIITLPLVLALGGTAIGIIFRIIAG
jgi:hypothetical protein